MSTDKDKEEKSFVSKPESGHFEIKGGDIRTIYTGEGSTPSAPTDVSHGSSFKLERGISSESNSSKPEPRSQSRDVPNPDDITLQVDNLKVGQTTDHIDLQAETPSHVSGSVNAKAGPATFKATVTLKPNPETLTHQIHKDSASDQDELGFTPIVQALARMILHSKTAKPITIGIHGEWGAGKSSVLLQLRKELNLLVKNDKGVLGCTPKQKIVHVEFDAWLHGENSSMLGVFLQEITNQIEKSQGVLTIVLNRLKYAMKRVSNVAWLVVVISIMFSAILMGIISVVGSGWLTPWISLLPVLALFAGKPSRDVIARILSPLGVNIQNIIRGRSYKSEVDGIHDFKKTLSEILRTNLTDDGVLVVYVDDLDRCEPKSVVTVIETINKFLEIEKCCFILGIEQNRTAELINKYYGYSSNHNDTNDRHARYGIEFLHKMIQLPIHLPVIDDNTIFTYVKSLHGGKEDIASNTSVATDQSVSTPEISDYKDIQIPDHLVTELMLISKHLNSITPRNIKRFQNKFLYYYLLAHVWTKYSNLIDPDLLPLWLLLRENYAAEIKYFQDNPFFSWSKLQFTHTMEYREHEDLKKMRNTVQLIANYDTDTEDHKSLREKYFSSPLYFRHYMELTG